MSNARQCRNCFGQVDRRKDVRCSECGQDLHKDCAIEFDGALLCDVCFLVYDEKKRKNPFGEFTLPDFIRRTYIETYRTCPYKFYLEVIKGNEAPPTEYTQVGSDVHEIIEYMIKDGWTKEQADQKIYSLFHTDYDDVLFQNKSKEDMRIRAQDSIDTFYEVILPTIQNVVTVEETIFTNIGDNIPNIRITMDLITEEDGELHMHDWKTGKVMVGQKLSTDLQAPLYIYSVQQKFNKPVKSFTFYYLQENKTRTFIRSEIDPDTYICTVGKREYKINLTDAIREVKSIFNRIKKGDFHIPQDTKKMYFPCKVCHLREAGLCAGADEQAWINLSKVEV